MTLHLSPSRPSISLSRVSLVFVMAAAVWLLGHDAAWAQGGGFFGSFRCSAGVASGSLFRSATTCPTTLTFDTIFSFLVCNMEQLSSNLMGHMLCGMIKAFTPAITALLTLSVVIFGMGFTIGVIPATGREFALYALKIAFVMGLTTQADLLINIGYKFFINGIRDGVAIVLSNYVSGVPGSKNAAVYTKLDMVLAQLFHYATDAAGFTTDSAKKLGADGKAISPCKNAVFAAVALMMIAFPPIAYMAIALVFKLVMTFVRAVFGYVYALVGIAFLMTISPIFISFFLFKQTKPFFDKWVGYLASFSLQIVILFAFLSFVLSLNVSNITKSFSDIIVDRSETVETSANRTMLEYCTICKFEVVDSKNQIIRPDDVTDANGTVIPKTPNYNEIFLKEGKMRCIKDKDGKVIALNAFESIGPGDSSNSAKNQANIAENKTFQNNLLKFAGTSMMMLLVLTYVVDGLLTYAASLSQTLASALAGYAPQLGGGKSNAGVAVDMPGQGTMDRFEQGFESGFTKRGNGVSAVTSGIQGGASNVRDNVKNDLMEMVIDPNKFK